MTGLSRSLPQGVSEVCLRESDVHRREEERGDNEEDGPEEGRPDAEARHGHGQSQVRGALFYTIVFFFVLRRCADAAGFVLRHPMAVHYFRSCTSRG